jgi:hypothetical protein
LDSGLTSFDPLPWSAKARTNPQVACNTADDLFAPRRLCRASVLLSVIHIFKDLPASLHELSKKFCFPETKKADFCIFSYAGLEGPKIWEGQRSGLAWENIFVLS